MSDLCYLEKPQSAEWEAPMDQHFLNFLQIKMGFFFLQHRMLVPPPKKILELVLPSTGNQICQTEI